MTDTWTKPPGVVPSRILHDSPMDCGTFQRFSCLIARCPYYPTCFFSILSFYPHMFMVFICIYLGFPPQKKKNKHLLAIDSPFLVDIPLREIKPTSSLRATDPARCSLGSRWEVKSPSYCGFTTGWSNDTAESTCVATC